MIYSWTLLDNRSRAPQQCLLLSEPCTSPNRSKPARMLVANTHTHTCVLARPALGYHGVAHGMCTVNQCGNRLSFSSRVCKYMYVHTTPDLAHAWKSANSASNVSGSVSVQWSPASMVTCFCNVSQRAFALPAGTGPVAESHTHAWALSASIYTCTRRLMTLYINFRISVYIYMYICIHI